MADEKSFIDRIAYITWNNKQGVQALAYKHGFQPSSSNQELYEAAKQIASKPEGMKELIAVHPDKEIILSLNPAKEESKFCSRCTGNMSGYSHNDGSVVKTTTMLCSGSSDELKAKKSALEETLTTGRLTEQGASDVRGQIDMLDTCLNNRSGETIHERMLKWGVGAAAFIIIVGVTIKLARS